MFVHRQDLQQYENPDHGHDHDLDHDLDHELDLDHDLDSDDSDFV